MTKITLVPMRKEHREAVSDLLLAQQVRQHALGARVRVPRSRQEIAALLALLRHRSQHALVALDGQGRVLGCAIPDVWELPETSILRAFLSARNGVTPLLVLPDPAEEDAADVAAALLTALMEAWQHLVTTGDLVRWPSADAAWLAPVLLAQGFRLDSVCAQRSLAPLSKATSRSASEVSIRAAQPTDEESLVALFEEELRYHERYTPFVRSSPAVLAAFRHKLARRWQGVSLHEGAPLILVAEQAGQMVAMAENTLLTVGPEDEPGFTPPGRYGCIDNVSVREEVRGQGLGRRLVQAVFDTFAATGWPLDGYLLWYNPDNPQAGRFWPHLGFQPMWTTFQRLPPSSGSSPGASPPVKNSPAASVGGV